MEDFTCCSVASVLRAIFELFPELMRSGNKQLTECLWKASDALVRIKGKTREKAL